MDDIRPPQRGSRPPGHGNSMPQQNNQYNSHSDLPAEQTYQAGDQPQQDYQLPEAKKKKSKGKTFALVIFILLFLATAAAAVWLYLEQQNNQEEIDSLNTQVLQLKSENYQLKYDTKDAVAKALLSSERISELRETSKELKEACGDACSVIIIPE